MEGGQNLSWTSNTAELYQELQPYSVEQSAIFTFGKFGTCFSILTPNSLIYYTYLRISCIRPQ